MIIKNELIIMNHTHLRICHYNKFFLYYFYINRIYSQTMNNPSHMQCILVLTKVFHLYIYM